MSAIIHLTIRESLDLPGVLCSALGVWDDGLDLALTTEEEDEEELGRAVCVGLKPWADPLMGVPSPRDSREEPEPAGEPAAGVTLGLLGDFFPSKERLKTRTTFLLFTYFLINMEKQMLTGFIITRYDMPLFTLQYSGAKNLISFKQWGFCAADRSEDQVVDGNNP